MVPLVPPGRPGQSSVGQSGEDSAPVHIKTINRAFYFSSSMLYLSQSDDCPGGPPCLFVTEFTAVNSYLK